MTISNACQKGYSIQVFSMAIILRVLDSVFFFNFAIMYFVNYKILNFVFKTCIFPGVLIEKGSITESQT